MLREVRRGGRKAHRWLHWFVAPLLCAAYLQVSAARVDIDIPTQSADKALVEFARQSGVSVLFPTERINQIMTNSVRGEYQITEALAVLLRGTGLAAELSATGVLTVKITDELGSSAMQSTKPKKWLPALLSALAAAFSGHSGIAQEAGAASNDERRSLEEIIVTAQKRVENLQAVPISAQVISGQALAESNYNSLEELTETVPSVHVANNGFSNDIYIRGIGSGNANPSFDQSVATFEDDIYHGRSKMSDQTFLDLDRIEVLKGPQSTFFGNNAIAGALNIVSKKPGDSFDASSRVLYGEYGQYAVEGAVGGPVTDIFGVRLAVTRNGEEGWIKNVNTDQYAPDQNNEAARLTMVLKPTDVLDATLKLEAGKDRTAGTYSGAPQQKVYCPPPAPYPPSNNLGCPQQLSLGGIIPTGVDNDLNTGLPGQFYSLSTFESVLTVNYRQWDHTFTSVTGFNNYHVDADIDNVALPVDLATSQAPEKYHQFSQELRVASPTDQAVEYLAGLYFQTDELNFDHEIAVPLFNFIAPPGSPLAPYLPLASDVNSAQGEHLYSVFGSVKWKVTDRLSIGGGVRASWVDKNANIERALGTGTELYGGFVPAPALIQSIIGGLLGAPTAQSLSQSNHAWMPSAIVQYQIDPKAMGYFSYSRGFKAGGFNGEQSFGPLTNLAFGPEYVNAYELGLKSKWLDDTVLLNVDVFRSDYKDLQVNASSIYPGTQTYMQFVQNAANSRSQGLELEAQWAASRNLRFSANITYLDSHYVDYTNAPQTTLQVFCAGSYVVPYCSGFPVKVPPTFNATGQPTAFAPRWSGSVAAAYSAQLPGGYKLTTQLSPYFTSTYYSGDDPAPSYPYPALGNYIRLDARLTLETPDRRWAFDVIGKNLTDKLILISLTSKEEPRNAAVQFRYHF